MIQRRLIPSYIILSLASLWAVFPLYYMFCQASGAATGCFVPGTQLWSNIVYIVTQTKFMKSLLFSIVFSLIQTGITLLICSMAGYAFEVYHSKVKDFFFRIVLLAMMIPLVCIEVPLFILIRHMGLYDTLWGLILPFVAAPLVIMIFRQNARQFPHELMDAARVDGLREFGIYSRIFIPTMKGAFACAIIITFTTSWNTYLWPKVIMTNETHIPISVYVQLQDIGNTMCVVMLSMIPPMIIFFVFQKFFVEGMSGAVK